MVAASSAIQPLFARYDGELIFPKYMAQLPQTSFSTLLPKAGNPLSGKMDVELIPTEGEGLSSLSHRGRVREGV